MDPAQPPSVVTRADVPRLRDRVREVLEDDPFQHRSGWEIALYVIGLVVVSTASLIIWQSATDIALQVLESIVVFAAVLGVTTAVGVKIRFKGSRQRR